MVIENHVFVFVYDRLETLKRYPGTYLTLLPPLFHLYKPLSLSLSTSVMVLNASFVIMSLYREKSYSNFKAYGEWKTSIETIACQSIISL